MLDGNPTAPTPATSDDDTTVATTEFVKAVLLAAHPVGDIVMNVSGTNPGTYLGGTWVAWGSGRVPVGVDAAQSEFNTVEETGGAKTHTLSVAEMPSHDHGGSTGGFSDTDIHAVIEETAAAWGLIEGGGFDGRVMLANPGLTNSSHSHSISAQGSTAAHNNLQPYITCYMFKRTA